MKLQLNSISFFVLIGMMIMGCINETEQLKSRLKGNWIIVNALRNNRETRTLKDAYFKFDLEGQMETNILGDSMRYSYNIIDKEILQNSQPEIIYTIHDLRGDTIHLKSTIRNYNFDFIAVKNSN